MKKNTKNLFLVIPVILAIGYFFFMNQDKWCTPGTLVGDSTIVGRQDKEIRGDLRQTCLIESNDNAGGIRSKSWETKDKAIIYQEFYKSNVAQYSITYWSENSKRCKEMKRIKNRFVPEGIECTKI